MLNTREDLTIQMLVVDWSKLGCFGEHLKQRAFLQSVIKTCTLNKVNFFTFLYNLLHCFVQHDDCELYLHKSQVHANICSKFYQAKILVLTFV